MWNQLTRVQFQVLSHLGPTFAAMNAKMLCEMQYKSSSSDFMKSSTTEYLCHRKSFEVFTKWQKRKL